MEKTFPLWALAVVALIALACIIVHILFRRHLVNVENIKNKTSEGYKKAEGIVSANPGRKSLTDYISFLGNEANDPKNVLLTNFYFSTVNATGLFFPAKSGVYSPNAVKFAVHGGARAFVLDIWPCLEPFAGFKPILHSVEKGSKWRRVSMNSMDVETAIEAIVSEVYTTTIGNADYRNDVVLLYFRFQGGPRNATYDSLAKTCARVLSPYKLDASFSSCRGNASLFKTPIINLKGKVIVLSSKTKQEMENEYRVDALEADSSTTNTANPLIPYINICPQDSIPVEVDINAVDTLSTNRYLKDSIVFVAPPDYSKEAETNNWGAKINTCINNGIHCMALNLYERDKSEKYADILFNHFGTYSYKLKDDGLRIKVDEETPATSAGDTNVGVLVSTPGLNQGTLAPPPR